MLFRLGWCCLVSRCGISRLFWCCLGLAGAVSSWLLFLGLCLVGVMQDESSMMERGESNNHELHLPSECTIRNMVARNGVASSRTPAPNFHALRVRLLVWNRNMTSTSGVASSRTPHPYFGHVVKANCLKTKDTWVRHSSDVYGSLSIEKSSEK